MLMQMKLKDKPYKDIKAAFMKHMDESSEIPTPHDIIKRIDKPIVPRFYLTEEQEAARQRIMKRDNL